MGRTRAHVQTWLITAAWFIGVVAGIGVLTHYKQTPGEAHASPERWPPDSQLPRVAGHATVVLFAHPRCPCTRASLTELERVAQRLPNGVEVVVSLIAPAGTDPTTWQRGELFDKARMIPGARVFVDVGRSEADRFAARTSGEVLLYDATGALLFAGGITPSRGHVGDSEGASALLKLATRTALGDGAAQTTPSYGCALNDPRPAPPQEEGR